MTDTNAPWPPATKPAPLLEGSARRAILWMALAVLAAALVTAFVSILEVIGIWFEYQYVPIARGVLGIVVALVALYVVRILVLRPRQSP